MKQVIILLFALCTVASAGSSDLARIRLVGVRMVENAETQAPIRLVTFEVTNTATSPIWIYGRSSQTDADHVQPVGNSLRWDETSREWRAITPDGRALHFEQFAALERVGFDLEPGQSIRFMLGADAVNHGFRLKQTVFVSGFLDQAHVTEIASDEFVLP